VIAFHHKSSTIRHLSLELPERLGHKDIEARKTSDLPALYDFAERGGLPARPDRY